VLNSAILSSLIQFNKIMNLFTAEASTVFDVLWHCSLSFNSWQLMAVCVAWGRNIISLGV